MCRFIAALSRAECSCGRTLSKMSKPCGHTNNQAFVIMRLKNRNNGVTAIKANYMQLLSGGEVEFIGFDAAY